MSAQELAENLVAHVLDSGVSQSLIDQGRFPANWVTRYLALVERATNVWRDEPAWPREVVGAIHFASFYLAGRYETWSRLSGRANEDTEAGLRRVRGPSEIFLLAGVTGRDEQSA